MVSSPRFHGRPNERLQRLPERDASRKQPEPRADLLLAAFCCLIGKSWTGTTMLEVKNVTLSRGGTVLIRDASFLIGKGEKAGLVGVNGAGKTTSGSRAPWPTG